MHWMTPDELVTLGFSLARVVMMNEGHDDWRRVPRTRRTGRAILPAAHAAGCRVLAMEALGSFPDMPQILDELPDREGYLGQPEMSDFVDAALGLGWKLVAYEANFDEMPPMLQDTRRDLEATNWREDVQAAHLVRALEHCDRMLVWCGNSHHLKRGDSWMPMGARFAARAPNVSVFAIDQLATVSLGPAHVPRYQLTPELVATLTRLGGTAGFTRENPPPGMTVDPGFDAVVLSVDNAVE